MKLYFAPGSRAVRIAWILEEMGLDYELERFTLGDAAMRAPGYLAKNPNGRVPTLEDGDVTISESTAIAQYLVARHGDGSLAPAPGDDDFADYLQWLHYAEGMIMAGVNNFVVETILLPPDRRSDVHAARAKRLVARTLGAVDAHMAERDYLARRFTAADTITGHACMIALELVGVDAAEMPHLSAYVERLKARPALRRALAL